MKKLMEIEGEKARERMSDGGKGVQNSAQVKVRDLVASQFGISHDTLNKEITILDNKDSLTPSDFAEWDP